MKKGSTKFVSKTLKCLSPLIETELQNENQDMNLFIKIILILKEVKNDFNIDKNNISRRLLEVFKSKINVLSFEQTCLVAKGFEKEFIDEDFAIDLQNHIYHLLPSLSFEEFQLFIESFVCTYIIDEDLYKIIRPMILSNLKEFELIPLMKLARSVYILDIQKENEIWEISEKMVLGMLKDYEQYLGIEEYFEIILTFHLSRIGSRELFKLLESKFTSRVSDFEDDTVYLEKISHIFATSGLVHPNSVEIVNKYLTL